VDREEVEPCRESRMPTRSQLKFFFRYACNLPPTPPGICKDVKRKGLRGWQFVSA